MHRLSPALKLLSAPQAAALCGVSRITVCQWIRKGKLRAYRTGGRNYRVRPSDLVAYMRGHDLAIPEALLDLASSEAAVDRPLEFVTPGTDGEDPGVLTVPEAAALCGVQRYTLWRWVHSGQLAASRGKNRVYHLRVADLVAFMEENEMFVPGCLRPSSAATKAGDEGAMPPRGILVVDADDRARAFAVRAFHATMHVFEAKSGAEALELLLAHNHAIHIVHVNLESLGQDGFSVLPTILDLRRDLAVIALFADLGGLKEEIISHPLLVPVLQKPVTRTVLEIAVAETEARRAALAS